MRSTRRRAALLILISSASIARAADDRAWPAARAALADLNYKNVLKLYAPLQAQSTEGSPEWTEATFCVALAHQQIQPLSSEAIAESRRLYEQVIAKSNDDRYAARAMMNIGRILELRDYKGDTIDFAGAHDWYRKIVNQYPDQPIAAEAVLRGAAALVMAYDVPDFTRVKRGIAEIETFLAARPGDPHASMMWQYAGDTYFSPLGDYKNALRCYEQTDKIGWTDQGNQGPWYWRCSQLAEMKLNQPAVAAKYYGKIITDTPNSGKAYEAMLALRRLGYPIPESKLFQTMFGDAPPATQPTPDAPAGGRP